MFTWVMDQAETYLSLTESDTVGGMSNKLLCTFALILSAELGLTTAW